MSEKIEEWQEYLSRWCNKLQYGECYTLSCLHRESGTCPEYEIHQHLSGEPSEAQQGLIPIPDGYREP